MCGVYVILSLHFSYSYPLLFSKIFSLNKKNLAKRPPKDTIRRFLTAQYKNYGAKFIEFMFGNKALAMFSKLPTMKAIEIISISLAGKQREKLLLILIFISTKMNLISIQFSIKVSPNIHEFAKVMEMTPVEKNRLALTLESIYTGQVGDLPIFVVNSASEGLSTIAEQLIRTQFLTENGNEN